MNITSSEAQKYDLHVDIQSMNNTKDDHEQQKESRELVKRGLEEKSYDDLPLIRHASAAPLWSSQKKPPRSKLQDLDTQV